jgi:hypothetical protein
VASSTRSATADDSRVIDKKNCPVVQESDPSHFCPETKLFYPASPKSATPRARDLGFDSGERTTRVDTIVYDE